MHETHEVEDAPEIGIDDLARSEGTVVDVREPDEYDAGHVPGALSIPMGRLPGQMGGIDRSAPVFVICASGNRSRPMARLLRSAGFDAHTVSGGTQAWAQSGRPTRAGEL